MRLLKKVRKLSRVLGEYPGPIGLDDVPAMPGGQISGDVFSGPMPPSPLTGVKNAQRKSFRHSWTIGFNAGMRCRFVALDDGLR